jgi:hypothetical protein
MAELENFSGFHPDKPQTQFDPAHNVNPSAETEVVTLERVRLSKGGELWK